MNQRHKAVPDDLPANASLLAIALQAYDDHGVVDVLLSLLEAVPAEPRNRTLDQKEWVRLAEPPSRDGLLRLKPIWRSHEFRARAADCLNEIAKRELNEMLAEVATKPTLVGYAKAVQFATDYELDLDDLPQWRILFEAMAKEKAEAEDEPLWIKACEDHSIAAYERYLSHDGPQRFATKANEQIIRLKLDEEAAWKAIPSSISGATAEKTEFAHARRGHLRDYAFNVKTRWQFERAQLRIESLCRKDLELLDQYRSGKLSAEDLFKGLNFSEAPESAISQLNSIDESLWARAQQGTLGHKLDYLERSFFQRHKDACQELIRKQVEVKRSDGCLAVSLNDSHRIDFSLCTSGVLESGEGISAGGYFTSLRRELCASSDFWFSLNNLETEVATELLGAFFLADAEESWKLDLIELVINRLNQVLRMTDCPLHVDLPTENEWEYAVNHLISHVKNLDAFNVCKDHFAY